MTNKSRVSPSKTSKIGTYLQIAHLFYFGPCVKNSCFVTLNVTLNSTKL